MEKNIYIWKGVTGFNKVFGIVENGKPISNNFEEAFLKKFIDAGVLQKKGNTITEDKKNKNNKK